MSEPLAAPLAAGLASGMADGLLGGMAGEIAGRGDLAHLVLFLWAGSASSLLVWSLREMVRSNRRFDDFVDAIARLNRMIGED